MLLKKDFDGSLLATLIQDQEQMRKNPGRSISFGPQADIPRGATGRLPASSQCLSRTLDPE
jgi:hypothetical protein